MDNSEKGEITVFLSIIFTIILALISTLLEKTRIETAESFMERSLISSMESLWSQYDNLLFDKYHIFAYDTSFAASADWKQDMENEIIDCMEYTFNPNKELTYPGTSIQMKNLNLYGINISDIDISDYVSIVDYSGDIFFNQAVEYVKYSKSVELLSDLMEKDKVMEESKNTSKVISRKLELEDSISEIDKSIIDLMECVEGINFSKGRVKTNKSGLLKTNDYFVKKLCPKEINMSNLGILNDLIYKSLKSKYINPVKVINDVYGNIDDFLAYREEIENYIEESKRLEKISVAGMTEGEINKLNGDKANMEELLNETIKKEEELFKYIKDNIKKVKEICVQVEKKIIKGEDIIWDIKEGKDNAEKNIKEFEKFMDENKSKINETAYKSIIEDTDELKLYVEKGVINLDDIESALKKNKKIVENVKNMLKTDVSKDREKLTELKNILDNVSNYIGDYDVKSLRFNYENMIIDDKVKNPLAVFKNFIKEGVMGIVIDDIEKISKLKLMSNSLPSLEIGNENSDSITAYDEVLNKCENNKYSKDITKSFDEFGEKNNVVGKNENEFLKSLLFNLYIFEHFNNKDTCDIDNKSRSPLLYEQEYIICGNYSDYENINNIVSRVLFIRTVLNFLYLISSRDKSSLAESTAVQLVGFLGFLPLISLVKTVILVIWSFEEALIDTRAIMNNKAVPFIKNNSNFKLKYNDILSINKLFIEEKANLYKEKRTSKNDFVYEDYIMIFLLTESKEKKIYKSLDMIQMNLSNFLNTSKLLKNYLYSIKVNGDFNYDKKYIDLPFLNSFKYEEYKGYRYKAIKELAY